MIRRPPRSTRTDTLLPYTTLFRSGDLVVGQAETVAASAGFPQFLAEFDHRFDDLGRFERTIVIAQDRFLQLFRELARLHHACPFGRSEEHTSELQSLMRISYAVFCLKKTKKRTNI